MGAGAEAHLPHMCNKGWWNWGMAEQFCAGQVPGMRQNTTGKVVWVQFVKKLEPLEVQVESLKRFLSRRGTRSDHC